MALPDSKVILVVEDDPAVQFAVSLLLESEGYQVLQASNGREALETIGSRGMPHLILLDMKMPIMNGWEFASEFRAKYGHQAPIVVMTAAADAEKRATDVQADGWLSKPFKLDELLEAVKNQSA